ncbi:MAG: response regulator, partial [Cyclobacteriaceae bacterium]|nr:response regulator [Cyclobacteriaceae bacterium]
MSREILIVEDEALIALSLKEQIEGFGYLVSDIVDTGESVIDSVIREKPDLILMDINLKGSMDGIEAASTVTKKFDIPIIFLTSYSNKEVIERAKKIAPYGYIIKSIEESNLQISIDVALNKHYFNQKFKLKKEIELKSISHTATKHKQEIDQFTYNVSHALLGPVKSMQGLVNLMFTENEINPE